MADFDLSPETKEAFFALVRSLRPQDIIAVAEAMARGVLAVKEQYDEDLSAATDELRATLSNREVCLAQADGMLRDAYDAFVRWGAEEDGVPDHAWPAFERIALALMLPLVRKEDGLSAETRVLLARPETGKGRSE